MYIVVVFFKVPSEHRTPSPLPLFMKLFENKSGGIFVLMPNLFYHKISKPEKKYYLRIFKIRGRGVS